MQRKIDIAEKNLNRVHEWIRGIDQKVSIFLALQGVILTLLFTKILSAVVAIFTTTAVSFWDSLFILWAILALGFGVFESLLAIFPRINNNAKSHLYFGGIKNLTLSEYKNGMKDITDEDYFEELCEQVHRNSVIAVAKAEHFQKAIIIFLLGIGLLIVSYISFKFF